MAIVREQHAPRLFQLQQYVVLPIAQQNNIAAPEAIIPLHADIMPVQI